MFYSHNDLNKLEKFNKDKTVQERENARVLLQEMEFYAESPTVSPSPALALLRGGIR